ncbi:MAG: carboxypeptidase-like regulatory domain-containing protein [Acidobacteriota bacterium]|nr:carboxypeptidase-like regulatory domain-containing protein [Acidobacteriota bacterium]
MRNSLRTPLRDSRLRREIIAALLVSLLFVPTHGQTPQLTVSLTVSVRDDAGAAVAGATVTLTRVGTDQTFVEETNAEGEAVFTRLPPGRYDIVADAPTFLPKRVSDLLIDAGRAAPVELVMGRTAAPTAVVDAAAPPALEREEELSALPNLNNDLTPLLQIVPGAVATGPSSLGRVIVDGKGNEQQTARLDGVDFTSQVDFPSADAAINPVGSFQKPEVAGDLDNSGAASGAFGFAPISGPGSGTVTEGVTYKGPESGWRAQFYGEHRNDALNARNFFDYDGKNALRRSRFGGKAGGPLFGSKSAFLFVAYDGWRGRTERNVYEAVPADAAGGAATGPLAQHMRSFLPPGTHIVPGASLNPDFVVARRRTRTEVESNAWDVRLDYFPFGPAPSLGPAGAPAKSRSPLTLRFTRQTAENQVPDGVTGRSQRQRFVFANALVGFRLVDNTRPVSGKPPKEYGHHFRFGFNLTRVHVDTESVPPASSDLAQSLVTTGGTVNVTGLPGQPQTVPVATLGGLIRGVGRGFDLKPVSYSAAYDYSLPLGRSRFLFRGTHDLFAGFEARFIRHDFDRLGGLTYSFPNVAALRAGTPGTVTFLSDLSGPSPFSGGAGRRRARQEFYMGYFQIVSQSRRPADPNLGDLEPALKLTYGLRYDYFGGVRERDHRAVVVDPLTGEILPQGAPFYRVDKFNIQPRLGFVYRLSDLPPFKDTILRAGVGLYSGVPRIGDLTLPVESDRFSTGVNGGTFPITPAEVIRGFVESPLTRQFQPLAFARDFSPLERVLKWDVQLTHTHNGYDFSAYYIGNVGRNLALANIANKIVGVSTNPDPTKPAIVVREFDIIRDGLVFQPFGEFFYRRGGGRSSFNALTFQLKRNRDATATPRQWLKIAVANFNAKYTLSRSVGNASGAILSNPFDPDADFGYNAGVARHSFTLSASYNLWQAPEAARRLDNPLWGWKIMPTLKVASGLPLVVRLNRPDVVYVDAAGNVFASPDVGRTAVINTPGGGSSGGAFVPDLLSRADPYARGGLEILNPAAFAVPAPGRFGNLRRGQLRGPAVVQFDLGLRRHLFLLDDEKLLGEFQVEFFNLFNRANFNNPTTSLPGSLGTNPAQNQLQPGAPFTRAAAGSFGIITAADPGRLIQFSLTLRFNEGFTK